MNIKDIKGKYNALNGIHRHAPGMRLHIAEYEVAGGKEVLLGRPNLGYSKGI
jgi:SLT domain-containing protein